MSKSSIEWTEFTWNPVTGCTKVSAGCKNCYAEGIANRFWGNRKFTDIVCHEDRLQQPLNWEKPKMIFVNSMSDLFHEKIPTSFIDSIYEVMGYSRQHRFQVLTKRPERALQYYKESNIFRAWGDWDHIWLGVSAEDQKTADERIPLLLKTPAVVVRWISIEPMLEEIDLTDFFLHEPYPEEKLDWVVVGCESGPKKRECKIEWIESIVEQCRSAENVPVFVKQIQVDGKVIKDINQFPEHLRIREYPRKTKQ